jgi:steroid delta-isomerase-like uncharacterized protein
MSEQENIQITKRVFDYFNSHNPDAGDQYLADDFRSEATGAQGMLDKDQNRMYNHRFFDAAPDLHFDLKDVFAQGDHVAASWVVTGTQKAPLALPNGDSIPPTNRTFSVPGCSILEFRGNKVSHQKIYWDQVTFLMQLGIMTEQDLMSKARR